MKEDVIGKFFRKGGHLDGFLEGYRERPGQVDMARRIATNIEARVHTVVEAGTGIGKSLAYSIPAALWALENESVAVIATANIALQEQLSKKDLPFVAKLMEKVNGKNLKVKLIKGMGNYLCRLKFRKHESDLDRTGFVPPGWDHLKSWARSTETGDKSDLVVDPGFELWSEVCASSDDCIGVRCPDVKNCYLFSARAGVGQAHVVICNYHILYTDILLREVGGMLPDYEVLVMDEAHEAPSIAMDFYGWSISHASLMKLSKRSRERAPEQYSRLVKNSESFFSRLMEKKDSIIKDPIRSPALQDALDDLSDVYSKASNQYDESETGLANKKRYQTLARQAYKAKRHLEAVENPGSEAGMVYHTESTRSKQLPIAMKAKAVDTSRFFSREIFSMTTVVATSATLTANYGFDLILGQFGLRKNYEEAVEPSPFDSSRVLCIVPGNDFPEPFNKKEHAMATARAIQRVAESIGGRTMGLFTSYASLNIAAEYLTRVYRRGVLRQGSMPRMRMIEEFKRNEGSIILATASFWQGIDIPGRALSCVIIDKIPFVRPDDPVLYYLDKMDPGSSFFEYSIPKATIMLKQGIGRLIRTEKDYGAVCIMDNRINTKGYGKLIQSAFPEDCWLGDDIGDVVEFMRKVENEE